jgi:hypothetical protein
MGIASMVIGIFSGILGFIPLCNYFALLPAIVGLVLGIISLLKKSKENSAKGQSIAGVVLNTIAIIMIVVWTIGIAANAPKTPTESMKPIAQVTENIEVLTVTADVLISDLEKNALNASQKYNGRYIVTTGEVSTIDSSGKYFCLRSSSKDFSLVSIRCNIQNDEQLQKVMKFTDKQIVTVGGQITDIGEIMGYSIDIMELQ